VDFRFRRSEETLLKTWREGYGKKRKGKRGPCGERSLKLAMGGKATHCERRVTNPKSTVLVMWVIGKGGTE